MCSDCILQNLTSNWVETADVSIICNGETLLAHRLVLASISPMLCEALKHLDDQEDIVTIVIPDITAEQIKIYLHHVYQCKDVDKFKDINDVLGSSWMSKKDIAELRDKDVLNQENITKVVPKEEVDFSEEISDIGETEDTTGKKIF